jgi:hypothetical protein
MLVHRRWSPQGPCPLAILTAALLGNAAYQGFLDGWKCEFVQ